MATAAVSPDDDEGKLHDEWLITVDSRLIHLFIHSSTLHRAWLLTIHFIGFITSAMLRRTVSVCKVSC